MSKPKKKRNKPYTPKKQWKSKVSPAIFHQIWISHFESFFEELLNLGDGYYVEDMLIVPYLDKSGFMLADDAIKYFKDILEVVSYQLNESLDTTPLNRLIYCLEKNLILTRDIIEKAYNTFQQGRKLLIKIDVSNFISINDTAKIKYCMNE